MKPASQRTVLLTLGRLPVALDIARSFAARGWRVLVAEPSRMHLARTSNAVADCFRVTSPVQDADAYLDELESIILGQDVDLVIPVSEESMYVAALLGRLPGTVEVFCQAQPAMLGLHDKFQFVRTAQQYGLASPDTRLADGADAGELTASGDFVVKPRFSCSGRRVSMHAAGEDFAAAAGMLVQRQLDGELLSSFAIARDGQVIASSVYRGTLMDGSVAVSFERVAESVAIDNWVSRFVAQSGHTGFIAFDFIVDAEGHASAIECNPRATSGIHFIRAECVAEAILGETATEPVHRSDKLLAESYSCFTTTLGALFSRRDFRYSLRQLRRARDVSWSAADPWPFLLMMINTWRIVSLALFRGHTFAAAAVLDIEWQDTNKD